MQDSDTIASEFIFDVTTDTFQEKVLERSHKVPIIVDFWAEWCAPCRMLGPVLEKAVEAQAGKVLLAKVNTDKDPGLAQRYRISGIPAVKAFSKGKLTSEFVGARDARFVGSFLEGLIPSPSALVMEQATALLSQRDFEGAAKLLRPLLDESQGVDDKKRSQIRLLLGELYLNLGPQHFAEVGPLLDGLDPRSAEIERAELLRQILAFFQLADEKKGDEAARLLADEKDADARYLLAAEAARSGDYVAAFEHLFYLVANQRKFRDDAGKKMMLSLFQYLGSEHPAVHEYRRRLQVIL